MAESQASHRPSRNRPWALALAIAALAVVLLMPAPADLPRAGQVMLAVFAFALVLWITEAVDYAISAALVITVTAVLLGVTPDPTRPGTLLGTSQGLSTAINGFSSRALALVTAALFFSVAMQRTGLDRRIALYILHTSGRGAGRLVAGIVAVSAVLSLFMPSATARIACMAPIILGLGKALDGGKRNGIAAVLMIAAAHAGSLWNAANKTGDAQNLIAAGLMQSMLGESPSWPRWFAAGAPLALAGSIALYGILRLMMPSSFAPVTGDAAVVEDAQRTLGPLTVAEKKLLTIAAVLLALWGTEHVLHPLDSATVTVAAVTLMFLPGVGILSWKEAQGAIPWGTIALFGAGISLGQALLKFQTAPWLANHFVALTGLHHAPALTVLMVMSAFLMAIHIGFASSAALSAAMIPIVIGVLQTVGLPAAGLPELTMLLQFTVSFGFILPVNSPHNLLAYATETYSARIFILTGLVLSVAMLALQLLFALTYWSWLGYL